MYNGSCSQLHPALHKLFDGCQDQTDFPESKCIINERGKKFVKLIKSSLSFQPLMAKRNSLTFVFFTSVTLTLSLNFGSTQKALMLSWCFSILYFCVLGQKSTLGGSPSCRKKAERIEMKIVRTQQLRERKGTSSGALHNRN